MLKFNERGLDVHHARLSSSKRKNFVCVVSVDCWSRAETVPREILHRTHFGWMYTIAVENRRESAHFYLITSVECGNGRAPDKTETPGFVQDLEKIKRLKV